MHTSPRPTVRVARRVHQTLVLCLLALWLLPAPASAQTFFYTQYRTAQGLPSNDVHAAARDSLGFLWVATDDGLARYDGQRFTTYVTAPSDRAPGALLRRTDGTLLYADASGIVSVVPKADTAAVRPLTAIHPTATDSTVTAPDGLYEDASGALWVSQTDGSVARVHRGAVTTFTLGDASAAPPPEEDAARIHFAEDSAGRLWAAKRSGALYRYEPGGDRFQTVLVGDVPRPVRDLHVRGDTLWAVGDDLLRARVTPDGTLADVRRLPAPNHRLTHAVSVSEGLLFGTMEDGLVRAAVDASGLTLQPVYGANDPHRTQPLPFRTVRHVHVDRDGALWVSTPQGLVLLQTRFFRSVSGLTNYDTFAMHPESDGVLASFGDAYRVATGAARTFRVQSIESARDNVVTSLASRGDTTWVATSNTQILRIRNGDVVQRHRFDERGGTLFYLYDDRRGDLWFCQAPDGTLLRGVGRIAPNGSVRLYDDADGLDTRILSLRESPDGTLYAVGIGTDTYLYRYDPAADRFANLSRPLGFTPSVNFEVHDLAVSNDGTIWLATTDGLLRYANEQVERVDLGSLTTMEMRSVEAQADGHVWMATATRGLVHYHDERWVRFDQDRGLISSVMVYRTLRLDGRGRLWAGTEEGAIHSRDPLPAPEATPTPRLLDATVNGTPQAASDPLSLRTSNVLQLRVAALTFPSTHLEYQYRAVGAPDSTWEKASAPSLRLASLTPTVHHVEVRARNGTGHYWSEPLRVPVDVRPVWYRTWWAYTLLGLFALGGLGFTGYLYRERQQAKRALRESQARLHGLAHSVPGVIFQFYARPDDSHGTHFISQQAASVLGLAPDPDAFYDRFRACLPEDRRDAFDASVRTAIENEEQWSFETPFVKPTDETIWIQGISTPEQRDDELVFNGVILDVTARKRLETQLRQAHKMETVGTLAGGIAHDFNNILHTATAYLDLAREEVDAHSTTHEFLTRTHNGLEEAEALADKLLTLSQPDSTTVREPVALAPLVESALDLASSSIPDAVTVRLGLDADACVRGDPDQLRQVVLNLVTNAGRAMAQDDDPPPDGHVLDVSLDPVEIASPTAGRHVNLDPGAYVHLRVRDTGLGMDEETAERIFDPFFSTEGALSATPASGDGAASRGTGLGLSVAYSAVEAHGGDITVESAPGTGTCFDVYLPAAPDAVPESASSSPS